MLPSPETFLSGDDGRPHGLKGVLRSRLGDPLAELGQSAARVGAHADAAAAATGPLEVNVVSIYRPPAPGLLEAVAELRRSRHSVRMALGSMAAADPSLSADTVAADLRGGKFQNLNTLLERSRARADWLIVMDDDVELPPCFLDRFLALCERFRLDLAQPAQTLDSHAAWKVTRRRPASLVRETRFVEIGPLTAFRRRVARELTPFPDLRYGWGLDLHWAALAEERGWRRGVVDALPVRHEAAPVAAAYPIEEAKREAAGFLADRPYLSSDAAAETIATHRRVRG